jgi:hypothetical protein
MPRCIKITDTVCFQYGSKVIFWYLYNNKEKYSTLKSNAFKVFQAVKYDQSQPTNGSWDFECLYFVFCLIHYRN